jgi:transposase-like protein
MLAQADEGEARELFSKMMRSCVRAGLLEAMAHEVDLLCGPKYHPDAESEFKRAGSERGHYYSDAGKEEIRRPRVRTKDGEEVTLESYRQASDQGNLFDRVVETIAAGMPVRGAEKCFDGAVKKTQASEMWVEKSAEALHRFRERSLVADNWLAIMVDGVFIGNEKCIVIAIGIQSDGSKHVLDFEPGSSENAETCGLLLERIVERGFTVAQGQRVLACLDGSKALRKAVKRMWSDAVIQECLVHTERVTHAKLPRKAQEEAKRLFDRLRKAQGSENGEEAFTELVEHVGRHNDTAAENLRDRKEALLAIHRLDVSSELNVTFLSTNLIENVIRNWRKTTHQIKNWKFGKDGMISRWTAVGLLNAEDGFRKIRGHQKLDDLVRALQRGEESPEKDCVPGPSATAPGPSTPSFSETPCKTEETNLN